MKIKLLKTASLILLTVMAPVVEAHTGIVQHGFISGLAHPLLGIDHLLAMIAIGIWAGRTGGKATWAMPLGFISVMTVAAIATQGAGSLPLLENGLAVSLLVLSLLIVLAVKLPAIVAMFIVSLFAIFHGAAHGVEWPLAAAPVWYVCGFIFVTGLLHACGVMLGVSHVNNNSLVAIRTAGATIAAAGAWMLLAQ